MASKKGIPLHVKLAIITMVAPCICVCLFLIFSQTAVAFIERSTEATVTGTVVNAYPRNFSSGDQVTSVYMVDVQKDDGEPEVFRNSDALLAFGKTNSADLYALLHRSIGKRFEFRVSWFRNTPLSQFRNIISVRPLD